MADETGAIADAEERLHAVEVVLFDLDGTLIDTMALILASMRHATETVLGEALADDVLMHNVGVPLIVQMSEFDVERAEEMLTVYREHNAIVHDDLVAIYPHTRDGLAALKRAGYPMAVVTSKSKPVAQRGLDAFGLGEYFETIVAYEDTEIHKPEAAPLLCAAERLGVDIGRCAYVGDSPHDMHAALAAGAVPVAALWGPFPQRVLEPGPAVAIRSIEELAGLLGRGGGTEQQAE